MSNIIDKIRVSGTDYTLSATSSGGNPTIEVTQAEYDALVSAGTVQEDTYYIITDSSIDYINSAQCQSQIDSSISGKADTSAVTEAINAAVSGKVSTSDFNVYSGATDTLINSKASQSDLNSLSGTVTGHTANTTIHVTSSEKQVWNAKSDFSGSYNDLTDKPTIPTSASQLTNDSGYITSGDAQSQIDSSISGKVDTSTYTAYTSTTATEIGGKASQSDLNSLSGTVIGHTANTAIHVTSSEKTTWSGKQDALSAGTGIDITNDVISVTGKVDTTTYNAYTAATDAALADKANSSDVYLKSETSGATEIATALSGKQATLVSSENIKTINNESILGSGNITIQSEVSSAITSGDTNAVAGGAVYDKFDEVEQVTAAALNDINDRVSEDEEVTAAALNALNANKQDKLSAGTGIEISGNVISATGGGGGNPTVELTQAEYDALVSAGTVSADTYYIITDATPVDMSNYYTSAQTNALLAGKQDTLSAGTGIEISGNVISATGGGSSNLPISAGTGTNSVIVNSNTNKASGSYSYAEGYATTASGAYSHAEGYNTSASTNSAHAEGISTNAYGAYSHAEGYSTKATGSYSHAEGRGSTAGAGSYTHAEGYFTSASGNYSHAEGYNTTASAYYAHTEGSTTTASGEASHAEGSHTTANTLYAHAEGSCTKASGEASHAEGRFTTAQNEAEHASGRYNVSSKANTTFGDSGNTLFSVGNGEDSEYRHNALDIRQNGDIYIVDTSASGDYFAKPMIKLQESLGGTASSAITSGDTNAVAGGAVYDKFDEVEQVTAQALNVLNESLSGKQDTLSAGTNITIVDNVISAEGGSITIDPSLNSGSTNPVANSAITTALNDTVKLSNLSTYYINGFTNYVNRTIPIFHRFDINNQSNGNAWWFGKINDKYVITTGQTSVTPSDLMNLQVVETSAITTSVTSSSTDSQVPSAKAVNDKLGGLSLVKLTQAQYDALATKDNNTLYVIVN